MTDAQKLLMPTQRAEFRGRQLAERFRVALSFMEKLLKQDRETGSIAAKVRTQPTPTQLSSEQLATLEKLVPENNDPTLAELQEKLEKATGVWMGISTVARMLRQLNLTRQKKSLHPTEKGSERGKRLGAEYWQLIQGILAQDLIFIDESGIHLGMTRLFARAPKGERARGKRPSKRGQNVSVISAISLKGVITQIPRLG